MDILIAVAKARMDEDQLKIDLFAGEMAAMALSIGSDAGHMSL